MGFFALQVLYRLGHSVTANTADQVTTLYMCAASLLGFDSPMATETTTGFNCSCNYENGTECVNSSCFNPVSS